MEKDVRIDEVHLDRMPLRKTVDPEYVRQLAGSIVADGLLQAIVVHERVGGGWSLIAGRQRLEAAKLLNWETIAARITDPPPITEIPALAENIFRRQMSPVEEAEVVAFLHEEKNLSIGQIVERTRHGTSWVQDRLALRSLPENLKDAVHHKHVSISAAMMLGLIEDIPLRDWYIHLAKVNGATVSQCEAWYQLWHAGQTLTQGGAPSQTVPQPLTPPAEDLFTCFGCVALTKRPLIVHVPMCTNCVNLVHEAQDRAANQPPGTELSAPPDPETEITGAGELKEAVLVDETSITEVRIPLKG